MSRTCCAAERARNRRANDEVILGAQLGLVLCQPGCRAPVRRLRQLTVAPARHARRIEHLEGGRQPVEKVGDTFVVVTDRESLHDVPRGRYDVMVHMIVFEHEKNIDWDLRPGVRVPYA